ncbi:hypothetical protein ASPTUDRAFT_60757 [Aspergillus tubingensis CBS 134.48]|uniref:Uncharacterized protein n=1 Tax=Aspergillus tubingensis (strain CBS 134.48) TaxID=767770 RepID=A0A1L9NI35_ASPTC|nr:hypothetical protein ASPTUDRAFT_60757 [Aspergillus tubingensis CBS 134.48]
MSCLSLLVLIQALNQRSDIQKGTWDMYRTTIVLQGNNTCTTLYDLQQGVSVPNYTHHVIIIILFGLSLTAAASQGRRGSYLLTSLVLLVLVSNKKWWEVRHLSRNMPKSQDRLVRRHHAASGLDQHVIHHPPSNISGKHWDRNGSFPLLRHSGVLGLPIQFRPADDPDQNYQALLPNDWSRELTPAPACNFRHLNEGRLRPYKQNLTY